jgi:hypothetical protein
MSRTRKDVGAKVLRERKAEHDRRYSARKRLKAERVRRLLVDETDGEVEDDVGEGWQGGDEPERIGAADPVTGLGVGEELCEVDEDADVPKREE